MDGPSPKATSIPTLKIRKTKYSSGLKNAFKSKPVLKDLNTPAKKEEKNMTPPTNRIMEMNTILNVSTNSEKLQNPSGEMNFHVR